MQRSLAVRFNNQMKNYFLKSKMFLAVNIGINKILNNLDSLYFLSFPGHKFMHSEQACKIGLECKTRNSSQSLTGFVFTDLLSFTG